MLKLAQALQQYNFYVYMILIFNIVERNTKSI